MQDEAAAALKQDGAVSGSREVAKSQLDLNEAQLVPVARSRKQRTRNLLSRNAGSREEHGSWLRPTGARRPRLRSSPIAPTWNRPSADYEVNILSARAKLAATRSDVQNAADRPRLLPDHRPDRRADRPASVRRGQLRRRGAVDRPGDRGQDRPDLCLHHAERKRPPAPPAASRGTTAATDVPRASHDPHATGPEPPRTGYPHQGTSRLCRPERRHRHRHRANTGDLFANADNRDHPRPVRPGPPAVRASRTDALLVPDRALGSDQGGPYLLVVGKPTTRSSAGLSAPDAEQGGNRVVAGERSAIEDRVVVDGLLRARPGIKVAPKLLDKRSRR